MKQTNERLCALAQKGDAAALDSLIDNNIFIFNCIEKLLNCRKMLSFCVI